MLQIIFLGIEGIKFASTRAKCSSVFLHGSSSVLSIMFCLGCLFFMFQGLFATKEPLGAVSVAIKHTTLPFSYAVGVL